MAAAEAHVVDEEEKAEEEVEVSRRAFNNTITSMSMRAADPSALLGKTIEVEGKIGKVIKVVNKKGSSTLHTIAFDEDGETKTLQLAKKPGSKATSFHIAS